MKRKKKENERRRGIQTILKPVQLNLSPSAWASDMKFALDRY